MNDTEFQAWQHVPGRVAELLPLAVEAQHVHTKAATVAAFLHGPVTWQPGTTTLTVYVPAAPPAAVATKYAAALGAWSAVIKDTPQPEPDPATEILIKQAALPVLGKTVDFTQKALGGPNPLTNTLVASLLAGGLGYGTGTILENLFPERYLERGVLRKNLGILGALGGGSLGAMNAWSNARGSMTTDDFYSAPVRNFFRGYLIPNDRTPLLAGRQARPRSILTEPTKVAMFDAMPQFDTFNSSGLLTPRIPVQQFNQAVWHDAQRGLRHGFQNHTPPAYAAATTGMLSGLSAGTRSPVIRPIDVIQGIASAGVGLATANVAGRALSALAGLTPAGQEKLQDLGLFGGMMHAIAPAILGMK